ncbi:MAG: hypothetical protein ABGW50_02080 [Thermococcus sp.]
MAEVRFRSEDLGAGKYDLEPTPTALYRFITVKLDLDDLCNGSEDFFEKGEGTVGYCNPPFSEKWRFLKHAVESGMRVLFLLPADVSVKVFAELLEEKKIAAMLVVGKRLHGRGARYPTMFVVTNPKEMGGEMTWCFAREVYGRLEDFVRKTMF